MDYAGIGRRVKEQYPHYNDIPDEELGKMVVDKYPQYQDLISQPPTNLLQDIINSPALPLAGTVTGAVGGSVVPGLGTVFGGALGGAAGAASQSYLKRLLGYDKTPYYSDLPGVAGWGIAGGLGTGATVLGAKGLMGLGSGVKGLYDVMTAAKRIPQLAQQRSDILQKQPDVPFASLEQDIPQNIEQGLAGRGYSTQEVSDATRKYLESLRPFTYQTTNPQTFASTRNITAPNVQTALEQANQIFGDQGIRKEAASAGSAALRDYTRSVPGVADINDELQRLMNARQFGSQMSKAALRHLAWALPVSLGIGSIYKLLDILKRK